MRARTPHHAIRRLAAGAALTLAFATPCLGQAASAPAPATVNLAPKQQPVTSGPRWEIEGHGGFSRRTVSSSGTVALPPAGAPIPSAGPTVPSRQTSSWLFGDGAEMLNQVNAEFVIPARITPLDDALAAPGLDYAGAAVIGVRARRVLTPRLSAELSFDVLPGSGDVSDELLDAADETLASFESAFRGLLESGPITSVTVTTADESAGGSARELTMTGALNWQIGSGGSFVPYLTFGGGVVSGMGDLSSIELKAAMSSSPWTWPALSQVHFVRPIELRLRFERGTTFVGLVGAGVRRPMSERWGFRIDGRVFLGRENSRLLIDANPDVRLNVPGDYIETLTNPNIQFSNDPATGRRSTLSGPALDGFAAFKATGIQTRVQVTVGVFFGF